MLLLVSYFLSTYLHRAKAGTDLSSTVWTRDSKIFHVVLLPLVGLVSLFCELRQYYTFAQLRTELLGRGSGGNSVAWPERCGVSVVGWILTAGFSLFAFGKLKK